ncbi:SLC13 family permease [Marinactinospora rubrisoli]|uniref:SLC13 family permease n=1 Tax=Marinactinospora rubrisoli TaxID=2715399 RepID=A0ABW2KPN8_9ACTN
MRRIGGLDAVAAGLFALGVLCVLTGALPWADAAETMRRTLPILLFLATVIVLAELVAEAEVFDVLADRMAVLAGGRPAALFALCVLLASVTTITLNLDTTAVLLTPVMLAVARRTGLSPLPLAMTALWLANTASLLLPVSNLTNLLAADRVALSAPRFAALMIGPQLAAITVTAACLWAGYWRGAIHANATGGRYRSPPGHRPRDPVLFRLALATCAVFAAGAVSGVGVAWVSSGCVAVLAGAFLVRRRTALRVRLLPWRLLVLVTGLFLTVQTIAANGLGEILRALLGDGSGPAGVIRAAATGAVAANLFNNLPVYLAAERVLPAGDLDRLLGLLIGVNAGPLALPWASLATLICLGHLRRHGVRVPWARFVLTGAVTATLAVTAATGAFLLVR